MKHVISSLLVISIFGAFIISCNKDNGDGGPVDTTPELIRVTPDNGGVGDLVKIVGKNFSMKNKENIILFGEAQADNPDAVTDLWNEIKKQEKAQKTASDTMKAVAGSMPALMRAAKVIKRAKQHGGCGPSAEAAWAEWQASPSSETLGRLLLALSGAAGDMEVEAELCLNDAVSRFISQYEAQEKESF